jgi:hypothetical protein
MLDEMVFETIGSYNVWCSKEGIPVRQSLFILILGCLAQQAWAKPTAFRDFIIVEDQMGGGSPLVYHMCGP